MIELGNGTLAKRDVTSKLIIGINVDDGEQTNEILKFLNARVLLYNSGLEYLLKVHKNLLKCLEFTKICEIYQRVNFKVNPENTI